MNTVRLVYRYDELPQYDEHEFKAMTDRKYGEIAGAMGFAEGTLTYMVHQHRCHRLRTGAAGDDVPVFGHQPNMRICREMRGVRIWRRPTLGVGDHVLTRE